MECRCFCSGISFFRGGKMKNSKRLKKELMGMAFILPCMIGLVFFYLWPMAKSFYIGLFEWKMPREPVFIGFQNYIRMAKDPLFYTSLRVTFEYALYYVPIATMVGIGLALLMNTEAKGMGVFRTIYYIPTIVPQVASAGLWLLMCNPMSGVLNELLALVGLPPQTWIYGKDTVVFSLALIAIWSSGNMVIIYLAGLQDIPKQLYEAADLEGASAFRKLRSITLPMLSPVIFYNVIMAVINSLQSFTHSFVMTEGGPANASLFYMLYVYRTAFQNANMGYASALGWVLFVIIAFLTWLNFRFSDKWVFYNGDN